MLILQSPVIKVPLLKPPIQQISCFQGVAMVPLAPAAVFIVSDSFSRIMRTRLTTPASPDPLYKEAQELTSVDGFETDWAMYTITSVLLHIRTL